MIVFACTLFSHQNHIGYKYHQIYCQLTEFRIWLSMIKRSHNCIHLSMIMNWFEKTRRLLLYILYIGQCHSECRIIFGAIYYLRIWEKWRCRYKERTTLRGQGWETQTTEVPIIESVGRAKFMHVRTCLTELIQSPRSSDNHMSQWLRIHSVGQCRPLPVIPYI